MSTHADPTSTSCDFTNGASLVWRLRQHISTVMFTCGWAWPTRWPIRLILGFWGRNVHKNGRRLDEPPCKICLNSFILGREIRNHTNKQTVNDISTPCLSACVVKKPSLTSLSRILHCGHSTQYSHLLQHYYFPLSGLWLTNYNRSVSIYTDNK